MRIRVVALILAGAWSCGNPEGTATPDGGTDASHDEGVGDAGVVADGGGDPPTTRDGRDLLINWGVGWARLWCNCLYFEDGTERIPQDCFGVVGDAGFPVYDYECVRTRTWELTDAQVAQMSCVQAALFGDTNSTDNAGYCGTSEHPRMPIDEYTCFDCLDAYVADTIDRCGIIAGTELERIVAPCLWQP